MPQANQGWAVTLATVPVHIQSWLFVPLDHIARFPNHWPWESILGFVDVPIGSLLIISSRHVLGWDKSIPAKSTPWPSNNHANTSHWGLWLFLLLFQSPVIPFLRYSICADNGPRLFASFAKVSSGRMGYDYGVSGRSVDYPLFTWGNSRDGLIACCYLAG